ncbi:PREDICTED: probable galactinol--sucrose galactosyltransferase 4 [Tarenaya hassleriana]|uniref:probable galactinol--sucrose galactosyltransferase 4 n=1 Tax=Tarenaya hassleriana TaxID=28532 RepID=UPI00053C5BE1|nr:PREDICTED: probable galactinol--sucrose galactosyltransferase 4 [Tarenaya hassleriana]
MDFLPVKGVDEKPFDLNDGVFAVNGVPLLSDVPDNVVFSPFSTVCVTSVSDAPPEIVQRVESTSLKGGFFGFTQHEPSDRLSNSLGRFDGRDFLSVFRFKTWWSTQWIGKSGSDLQLETQWIVLNVHEIKSYVVVIPIIEKSFRSSLNPGNGGQVIITAESGSTSVKDSSFRAIAYVHVSDNPYNLMREAFSAIRVHLNTFRLLEEKQLPRIINKFGWCTWDACYLTVEPASLWHGVKEFCNGGACPRFVIIDDGWQSINFDGDDSGNDAKNLVLGGEQMTGRLHRLDEGEKFRRYKGGSLLSENAPPYKQDKPKMLINKAIEIERAMKEKNNLVEAGETDLECLNLKIQMLKQELEEIFMQDSDKEELSSSSCCRSEENCVENTGLEAFTRDLRTTFKNLDDIYVWHSISGAWGGVKPGIEGLDIEVVPCNLSPGLDRTMPDLAVDKIVEAGIGLVHPSQARKFYNSMHSYLANAGITGVKVDVIEKLEYASEDYGGRVELAKAYYDGLTDSMIKNFSGTELLASMQQCNDFFYLGTKQISFGRVGDDFWFQDPNGDPEGVYWLQGVHMIHCSYNSLWMGQMIHPDWDMFQSDHVCAKFHAGSRAICGGPVYLSDSLGHHDFGLIKQLVFPDGTIPRCIHYALPTRDCLFKNPLFDQESLLKIFNFNQYGGVIGAFNCQGAGWDPEKRRIVGHKECYKPVQGSVHVTDIEWDQSPRIPSSDMTVPDRYIVYLQQSQRILFATLTSDPIEITIMPSSFELFNFVPVRRSGAGVEFAPIGLTDMLNCVGTIQELEMDGSDVRIRVKGEGKFLAYSGKAPKECAVNGESVEFGWETETGKLSFDVEWVEEVGGVSDIVLVF